VAPPCILVVDDDPAIRLLCRVNLELDGYAVVEASTLGEARSALDEREVDAVLLDVHVGAESGLDLLAELRAARPDLGVGLLTGSSGPRPRGSAPAPDMVVPKPFTLDGLRRAVGVLTHREGV
jgi:DNA-binding response OmpR family regulator